jgi:integrase
MRSGELRKLEWSQVDLEAREIRLAAAQTKGNRPRTAPIYGDLLPALVHQKEEHDANWPDIPWVFHWHRKPIGHSLKGWRRGHRTESVYLRYDIVSQKDLAIAREKLEAFHIEHVRTISQNLAPLTD